MKNVFYILLIFLLVFISCNNNKYKQTYVEFPNVKEIKASQIIKLDSLNISAPLIKVEDSLCCVCDVMAVNGFFFNLYTFPEFKYIKSFGAKGRGHNEIISISGVDINNGKLYALCPASRKIYVYDILDSDLNTFKEVLNIPDSLNALDITIGKDNELFMSCLNSVYRAVGLNMLTDKSTGNYFTIPPQEYHKDLGWLDRIDYNTKNNTLVSATLFGEVLSIQNMDDKFNAEITAVGSLGTPSKSKIGIKGQQFPSNICFTQLFCGDEYIYTVFSGAKPIDLINNNISDTPPLKINVYSYDGKPVVQYIPDTKDVSICYVDESSKKLFTLSTGLDGEYVISIYELEY